MYDRASRELSRPHNTTLETVGPGSYEVPSFLHGKHRTAVGYAPFGSMTSRETFVDVADQTIAAPGPGQYNLMAWSLDRVKGGQSLSNTSKRFEDSPEEIPGPGTYNLSKHSDWIKQPVKPISQEEDFMGRRIIFLKKMDPPSIPSPGKSYGYEEAQDGSLKPQKMPDKDASMGPAYYSVDHRDTQTTRNYKGVFFGKKDSKRHNFRGNSLGPGPGAYNPYEPQNTQTPMDLILEEQNRRFFEAKIPRYHELIPREEEKKGVPAPGYYQIESQFKNRKVGVEGKRKSLVAPFGSQATRFGSTSNALPAPGSYNDPRTAFETLKRVKGTKGTPFGQTSIRFDNDQRKKALPGPASYNVPDQVSEIIKKNIMTGKKKVPFGSTSMRTAPITRTQEALLPGPAHYSNNMDRKPKQQDVQPSSTFASGTRRLHSPPPIIKDIPPPGSYDVRKSYDRTQGRVLYPYSQKKNRNSQKRGGFLSSSTRFQDADKIQRKTTPGPGEYDIPLAQTPQGGLMVTRDVRFKPKKSEGPGPGNYELSPQFAHSVLKGTFNATLSNPMAKLSFEDSKDQLSKSHKADESLM